MGLNFDQVKENGFLYSWLWDWVWNDHVSHRRNSHQVLQMGYDPILFSGISKEELELIRVIQSEWLQDLHMDGKDLSYITLRLYLHTQWLFSRVPEKHQKDERSAYDSTYISSFWGKSEKLKAIKDLHTSEYQPLRMSSAQGKHFGEKFGTGGWELTAPQLSDKATCFNLVETLSASLLLRLGNLLFFFYIVLCFVLSRYVQSDNLRVF